MSLAGLVMKWQATATMSGRKSMNEHKFDLSERLLAFSARVIRLLDHLPKTMAGRKIADQLIRATMSVGANYEESRGADSRADFCHKLQIALKEMRESRYWLCLIAMAALVSPDKMGNLVDEATQLRAILGKAVATARGKSRECPAMTNPNPS
jgi:four helix bundle protein